MIQKKGEEREKTTNIREHDTKAANKPNLVLTCSFFSKIINFFPHTSPNPTPCIVIQEKFFYQQSLITVFFVYGRLLALKREYSKALIGISCILMAYLKSAIHLKVPHIGKYTVQT